MKNLFAIENWSWQMWLQDLIYNHKLVNNFLYIILSTSGLFLYCINACAGPWPRLTLHVLAVQVTDTNQLFCCLLWSPVPHCRYVQKC